MKTPDLAKLRLLALALAVLIITLVLAGVKLDVPAHISPLGIPLTIERPDLLTVGLITAAAYTTLRYIYYGMLVSPSPRRARRDLSTRSKQSLTEGLKAFDVFRTEVQEDIDRCFPRIGRARVTYEAVFDASGARVTHMEIPRIVRFVCLLEDFDFLLPVVANIGAGSLWLVAYAHSK